MPGPEFFKKRTIDRFAVIIIAILFASPLFAQPSISSFAPLAAPAGATVVINGSNFSTTTTENIVFFGATKAVVTAATTGRLIVDVPAGATYSYITVTRNNLTAYARLPFNIVSGTALTPASYAERKVPYWSSFNSKYVSMVASDVDVDGDPDLVCVNSNASCISVLANYGIPFTSFYESVWPSQPQPEGLAMGDINGDGKPDIVYTSLSGNEISVYLNIPNPNAFTFNKTNFSSGPLSVPLGVAVNDVDGDGRPDIVVADGNKIIDPITGTSHGTVSVYLNTTTPGEPWWVYFAPAVVFKTGDYPRKVFVGDIDGDRKPEIAVTNNGSGSVTVLRNNCTPGNVAFSGRQDYATGSNPDVITMGDLNADGKIDMAVGNYSSSTVSLLTNTSSTGAISFGFKQDLAVNSPLGMAIADISGDAMPDLVAVASTSSVVSVFENTTVGSAISFAPKIDYNAGSTPIDVSIVDLDADGYPEICVSNGAMKHITILKPAPLKLSVKLGNDTTLCQGDTLKLTARDQPRGTQYLWSTGATDSSITVKQTGSYWVKVTNGTSTAGDTIQVTFNPLPVFNLGNDTLLCDGQKMLLRPTVRGSAYLWQDGSHADSMVITRAGTYWLQLQKDGCTATDTINAGYKPLPPLDLGNDIGICRGSTVTLDAYSSNATYLWSTGANTATISTSDEGAYWVTVSSNGCDVTDTVHVEYRVLPKSALGKDTTICDGQIIVLKPNVKYASLIWQDGSAGATFSVTQPGTYSVTLTNGCEIVSDTVTFKRGLCKLFMPNAFTPNNDGINDVFRVKDHAFIKSFEMQIFNRWGQLIYRSKDAARGWNGTVNGAMQPAGNYVWMIRLTDMEGNSKVYKGTVLLVE